MDEVEPWEELDVDDSQIIPFSLRPCKRYASHSLESNHPQPKPSSSSLIPGPAGAVQAAMQRRTQTNRHEENPVPTQEFVRRVVENGDDQDHDFTTNPWLSALDFVTKQGQASDFPTPLGSIRKGINIHRVAQVVAIIKSCTPNGLGDLMLTLKDPTGTIGASIHHRVLSEGDFAKSISVGAVLVLQKIAVFSPSRSSCYLNITKNNMVQVISKDGEPLVTKDLPSSPVNNPASMIAPSSESSKRLACVAQEKFLTSQESTERIMNYLRQNSKARGSEVSSIEKHMETDHAGAAPGMICSGPDELYESANADVEKEASFAKNAMTDGITKMAVRDGSDTTDNERLTVVPPSENPNLGRVAEGDNSVSMTQKEVSASANSVEIHDVDQGVGRITGAKRQRQQPVISRASLPQYTEEELDLFEFD